MKSLRSDACRKPPFEKGGLGGFNGAEIPLGPPEILLGPPEIPLGPPFEKGGRSHFVVML
jgi:hypothetical protein